MSSETKKPILLHLDSTSLQALKRLAEANNTNRTALVRQAVREFLRHPKVIKRLQPKGLRRTPRVKELEEAILDKLRRDGPMTGREMWHWSIHERIPGMEMIRWNMRRRGVLIREYGAQGRWRIAGV